MDDDKQPDVKAYNSSNGTKSTTALGSMANLIARDQALN